MASAGGRDGGDSSVSGVTRPATKALALPETSHLGILAPLYVPKHERASGAVRLILIRSIIHKSEVAMENPLLVFISSVIAGMGAERQVAEAAIRTIPLSRPWAFEHSPASALPLAESYLRKVRECDVFVLLLGATLTDPVKREVETAQAAGKPLLVFLDASAPADVTAYAQSQAVKYATYQDTTHLAAKVAEAVGVELITGHRRHPMPSADLGALGDYLGWLPYGVVQISGREQVGRDQTAHGDLVMGKKIGRQVNTEGGPYYVGGSHV